MSNFNLKVKIHNQERYIAPAFKVRDLDKKNIQDIIDFYECRTNAFYIKPIEYLIKSDDSDYGFTIIGLCFTILDMLSLYFNPQERSDEANFCLFIEKYIPSLINAITPNCYYYNYDNYPNSNFIETTTEKLSQMLWRTFRHAIIHNGKVMSFGQYDWAIKNFSSFYEERNWTDKGKKRYELWLNPILFFNKVKEIFAHYIIDLKKAKLTDAILKNFMKKFEWDYGYGI